MMLNKIIGMIVAWYKLYTPFQFIYHKLTHIVVGGMAGYVTVKLGYPFMAIYLVLALAVGKEVVDHFKSYDPDSDSYKYDAPLSAHVLDVLVTCLGGVLGVIINFV